MRVVGIAIKAMLFCCKNITRIEIVHPAKWRTLSVGKQPFTTVGPLVPYAIEA